MKHIHKILLALVALVLATGCIKEEFDDCDNVTIYFQYLADGDEDVLYQYMKKVDLYVFDEGGHIMGVGHYNEDELKTFSAKPSFKLTPGRKYKVVAVGNAYERTEVVNIESETDFEKIYLQHPAWGTDDKVDGHDHNYMGGKEFFIPEGEFRVHRDTVTLYSSHVNVEIEVNGLPEPEATRNGEHPYELRIENSNACTDFQGNIVLDEKGTCHPELIYDYENNCYRTDDFALFRMNDPRGRLSEDYCSHQIVMIDKRTGTELVRGSIYNYVNIYSRYIDLTRQEATLPIAINFHEINAEITLPEWVMVDGKPEWN